MFAAAASAGGDDAVLAETLAEAGGDQGSEGAARATFTVAKASAHPSACACCLPRSGAAAALGRLFLSRARGDVAFFRRVIAVTQTPEGAAAVREAVARDPLVGGRFRMG